LVIAGMPEDPGAASSIVRASRVDARIRPILETIPAARVAELFAAADAAVLPRGKAWTSGSLILALSLGIPVVAARLPANDELLDGGSCGWLFEPGDADSLCESLAQAARERDTSSVKAEAARRRAENLPTWQEIAELTASLILGSAAP